jgi:hypothetical protein
LTAFYRHITVPQIWPNQRCLSDAGHDSLESFPAVCSQLLVDEPSRRIVLRPEPGMIANRCLAGKDDHAFTHVFPIHRVERHLDAHVRAAAGEG